MSSDVSVNGIVTELNDILSSFDISKNNSKLTTETGRVYTVANVRLDKNTRIWEVSDMVARGVFTCNDCGIEIIDGIYEPKIFNEDMSIRITHNEDSIRLNSSLIHKFREHPEVLTSTFIEEVAKVLIG